MLISQNYMGAFCEVKDMYDSKVIYTGYIRHITDLFLIVGDIVFFDNHRPTDVIITILNQSHGLNVFRAVTKPTAEPNTIMFSDLQKITDFERRSAFRVPAISPALVTLDSDMSVGYDAIVLDISVKGLSLQLYHSLNIDDTIHVQFQLFSNSPSVCDCRCNIVRNITDDTYHLKKYGCDFTAIQGESFDAVKAYVTKRRTEMMQSQLFKK